MVTNQALGWCGVWQAHQDGLPVTKGLHAWQMLYRRTHQEHCAGNALHPLRRHHALCQGPTLIFLFTDH